MRSTVQCEASGGCRVGLCPEDQPYLMDRLRMGKERSSRGTGMEPGCITSLLVYVDPGRSYRCSPN